MYLPLLRSYENCLRCIKCSINRCHILQIILPKQNKMQLVTQYPSQTLPHLARFQIHRYCSECETYTNCNACFRQPLVFRLFWCRKEIEASRISPLQARPQSVTLEIDHELSTSKQATSQTFAEVWCSECLILFQFSFFFSLWMWTIISANCWLKL